MVVRVGRILCVVLLTTLSSLISSACANEVALPADADAEILLGHEIYGARCARCHGDDGGGAIGPALRGVEERLNDDQQRDVLQNGRKSMPRFDTLLSDEEIDAVIRYSREIL